MENKSQDIIIKMADALKVRDKKTAQLLLTLMLDSTGSFKVQKQLKGLMTKPNFNRLLKDVLGQDFLGRDIEWVLVIPLWKYINSSNSLYELIFGIGQEITKKDLFLIWDNKKGIISLLNLKHNERRRDVMSLHELHNIANDYGLDKPEVPPHEKPIRYASIENIKEYIKLMEKDKEDSILKPTLDKFLLKPSNLRTELRYLNLTINILKDSSLILLKDVYDVRRNIKLERSKKSLGYDPYSIVRGFLRIITLYVETRGGSRKRPGRIPHDELKDVKQYLLNECKRIGTKEPTKKLVKEIFVRESGHIPSDVLTRKIKKDISVKLKHS